VVSSVIRSVSSWASEWSARITNPTVFHSASDSPRSPRPVQLRKPKVATTRSIPWNQKEKIQLGKIPRYTERPGEPGGRLRIDSGWKEDFVAIFTNYSSELPRSRGDSVTHTYGHRC